MRNKFLRKNREKTSSKLCVCVCVSYPLNPRGPSETQLNAANPVAQTTIVAAIDSYIFQFLYD